MIVDFNSYKTVGASKKQSLLEEQATNRTGFGITAESQMPKLKAEREAKRPRVKTGEDFEWTIFDFMQAPFGFIIGALQALPAKSASSFCSLYTSSARQYIITGREQMDKNETDDALTSFHDGFSYIDEMGPFCVYAFQQDLSIAKF